MAHCDKFEPNFPILWVKIAKFKCQKFVVTSSMTSLRDVIDVGCTLSFPYNLQIVCKTSWTRFTRNLNLKIAENPYVLPRNTLMTSLPVVRCFPEISEIVRSSKNSNLGVTSTQNVKSFRRVLKKNGSGAYFSPSFTLCNKRLSRWYCGCTICYCVLPCSFFLAQFAFVL